MGIGSGIDHDSVVDVLRGVEPVDDLAFDVGLVAVDRHPGESSAQFFQIGLERPFSVDAFFALSEQIQIGTIYDQQFHGIFFLGGLSRLRNSLQKYISESNN